MRRCVFVFLLAAAAGCQSGESRLRVELKRATGEVLLPAGVVEISSELVVPEGAHDLTLTGAAAGTTLKAAPSFRGAALLVIRSGSNIRLRGFRIDGNRAAVAKPSALPPSNVPFSRFTPANGILAEGVKGLTISDLNIAQVAGFAVLVARSDGVLIERVRVEESGSRNPKGRNNTTGGILLEEGTGDFRVLKCQLRGILGNGIWTHSLYTSPRNREGRIEGNSFQDIGRDAIQVGHATSVRVEGNSGRRIGYPFDAVDAEGGGIPVAIDTAGNVDQTIYSGNRFEEVNGKCIDLDGFHHGEVRGNSCINRGTADDYPYGHYGIVFNNSNPDMQSEGVVVTGNTIDGAKFGGIFVIGSNNNISGNVLRNLNLAHCNDSGAKYGCLYYAEEPDMLRSGIYLARGAARPAPARANVVRDNQAAGYGLAGHCVTAAPGVSLAANKVERNRCSAR